MSVLPTWGETTVSRKLGIRFPIVQGPFGGFASQRLTAAISNAGGLGSLGANSLDASAIRDVIAEIRTLTAMPFAVNLWISNADDAAAHSGREAFERSLAPLLVHFRALGVAPPGYAPSAPLRFDQQVRAVLDAKVPVFSFIFGLPPVEILDQCRRDRIITVGTATTADEAQAIQDAGVDAVAASGFEAGGHRGSFLAPAEQSLTGTFSLVQQVSRRVSIPVIAAGGIADAKGIVAAMMLGADGVQMGTAFLGCEESGASAVHRRTLLSDRAGKTGLTSGFTGRLARGIRNQLMDDLNAPGVVVLPYPLQRAVVRAVAQPAEAAGDAERLPMWAGQSGGISRSTNPAVFFEQLVTDAAPMVETALAWRATVSN